MNDVIFTYQSLLRLSWLGCWGVSVVACGSTSGTQGTEGPQAQLSEICSFCEPLTGGETSDFGGSMLDCPMKRQAVDSEIAKQYDLDLEAARKRIERPVDSPLYWVEGEDGKFEVTGYPTSERVQFEFKVTSEALVLLDPEKCDGTLCTANEGTANEETVEIEPSLCRPRLELDFDVTFHTTKSGLSGSTSGVAYQWQWTDDPDVFASAFIDLTQLQSPSLLISQPAEEKNYTGSLQLNIAFLEDEPSGTVGFALWSPLLGEKPDYGTIYGSSKVQGHWPSLPMDPEPETGGAEPEEK